MQTFDVLVVGGGASGLRAAIAAKRAGASVALITKVHPLRTNTAIAQGGINAPLGKGDSPERFAEDTLAAGDGLCDREVVRAFARDATEDVLWIERMGAPFNRDSEGKIDLRPFGSNSQRRSCYADDRTGHIVLQVLHEQFLREQIPSFEEWLVTSLAVESGACVGVVALGQRSGKIESFPAQSVVLATGGFTRIYALSTASLGTTGDGQYLAYREGARLRDMEMVQFHPTVVPKGHGVLISEAILAEGAELVNQKGERLVEKKTLPRDKICLALHTAIQNGGAALLDTKAIGKEKLASRFPQALELTRTVAGADLSKDPIPVRPAAHRPVGGIETNASGETSIRGLFAVGECASNGLNGAGRLAGNTLAEAVVFGRKAGEAAARQAKAAPKKSFPASKLADEEKRLATVSGGNGSADSLGKIQSELGRLMSEKVGIVRDGAALREAADRIQGLKERYRKIRVRNSSRIYNYEMAAYLETESMLNLAQAVALAAEARTESRGAHRRSDFPERDDQNWSCHTVASLVRGTPQFEKRPVSADRS